MHRDVSIIFATLDSHDIALSTPHSVMLMLAACGMNTGHEGECHVPCGEARLRSSQKGVCLQSFAPLLPDGESIINKVKCLCLDDFVVAGRRLGEERV